MPSYVQKLENQETFAAIDLGSNALRAIIFRLSKNVVEVVKNIREPLRLGEDVFASGRISAHKMDKTEEAFIKLFHIFTEYNVTDARAKATSAMRDSENGQDLIWRVKNSTGIEIETIKGAEEARLIFEAVKGQLPLKGNSVLMDVGGGSTEIIIVKNDDIVAVKSFDVGTVRLLQYKDQQELETKISISVGRMKKFIEFHTGGKKVTQLIGTGGNLRRIGKIRKNMLRKSSAEIALFEEIDHMEEAILRMSYVDRIRQLELDANRADVILPAIMLTHHLMKSLNLKQIYLPKVGLKEGIALSMLDRPPKKFILKD